MPSYSPTSIAEFAVTQAINLVRNANQIQNNIRQYDFRWQPSILSRSIDLTVAVIGTGQVVVVRIIGKLLVKQIL